MPSQSTGYGYGHTPEAFLSLVSTEYPNVSADTTYLDHAASTPPLPASLQSFAQAITTTLYANPHSQSPSSTATSYAIDAIRTRVLKELFGVESDGWDLIWTAGTTASLKLVGENFPWDGQSTRYRYLKESHTSVVGIRGCALARGARVDALSSLPPEDETCDFNGTTMWAYPAQCNVTGSRLGLDFCRKLKRGHREKGRGDLAVLVDAAAYLSTTPLDLGRVPYDDAPDFIACSFYKIYGHPTGLGALVIKRSSAHYISPAASRAPTYFGGGSIDALSTEAPFWVHPRAFSSSSHKNSKENVAPQNIHARHEHGTLPFLSIIALGHAMDAHNRTYGTHDNVSKHTAAVTAHAHRALDSLIHANGQPLVHRYQSHSFPPSDGSPDMKESVHGPIISFTLYTPSAKTIGHKHLENLATIAGFQIRTGGLCNTGVLARVAGLSDWELEELYVAGRVCGDGQEFGGENGAKPLGVARISFGASSTTDDVDGFISFLQRYFLISQEATALSLPSPSSSHTPGNRNLRSRPEVYLQSLVRFPIKSCGAQQLTTARLTPAGIVHDREFMLVNTSTGQVLSQKRVPRMVLIKPSINDEGEGANSNVMRVEAEGMPELFIPLAVGEEEEDVGIRMCATVVKSSCFSSPEADDWFTTFLGIPCQLHRHTQSSHSHSTTATSHLGGSETPVPILFSNESPFTLISQSSVDTVNTWIASDAQDGEQDSSITKPIHSSCFRANFTLCSSPPNSKHNIPSTPVSSLNKIFPPFHEDTLSLLRIGTQTFQLLARCRRCLMICVDQDTGVRMKEPFGCLARHRRNGRRRVEFGVHLRWRDDLFNGRDEEEVQISVGDRIFWTRADGEI